MWYNSIVRMVSLVTLLGFSGKIAADAPAATHETMVNSFTGEVREVEEWTAHDRVIAKQRAYYPLSPVEVTASLLYYKAFEDGLEYVLSFKGPDEDGDVRERMGEPHFKWDVGSRIAFLYRFINHDSFDLSATWTSFVDSAKASSSASANNFLVPAWGGLFFGNISTNASSRLKLCLNLLDVELGKRYFITKYIVFRPSLGIRSAWIAQNYRAFYSSISDPFSIPATNLPASLKATQDFFGIGVRTAGGLTWFFSHNWSATGRIAGSLLSGFYDVDQDYETVIQESPFSFPTNAHINNDYHRVQGVLEGALGIQWGVDFSSGRYRLTIGAEYEAAQWFRHNYFLRTRIQESIDSANGEPVSASSVNSKERGELGYQGLNLNFQIDF